MITAIAAAALVAGSIPDGLSSPSRVMWIGDEPTAAVMCRLVPPRLWECDLPNVGRGVVVIVGDNGVAYLARGTATDGSSSGGATLKRWGRAIVVTPGAATPEDIRDIRLGAWMPERSRSRPRSTRLTVASDSTVDFVRVAPHVFWIAGDTADPDAFISLEGPAIATTRVAIVSMTDQPPDTPLYVPAAMPFLLAGRVETSKGEDVDNTDVELFQPLGTRSDDPASADWASQSLIRAAVTRSDHNGRFSFDHLAGGPFLISVLDGTRGRGTARVQSLGEPVVVRLVPPATVTGRVLRNRLPAVGARVRFVPDRQAFAAAGDATAFAAEERMSGSDGRFAFQLPPVTAGELQVVGSDGASRRLQVSRPNEAAQIDVGDISLPDPRRLTVRLLENFSCVLSAVGPLGNLGLTTIRAVAFGPLHLFDVPEPGQWALDADCTGRTYSVVPAIVDVPVSGPVPSVDVHLSK